VKLAFREFATVFNSGEGLKVTGSSDHLPAFDGKIGITSWSKSDL
jgi:hypothetical protein